MRLRTKYALVLLAVMLVLGGVVLGSTELFKQQTVEQERANLETTADDTATLVSEAVHEQLDYVRWYAAQRRLADFSRSRETLGTFTNNSAFYAAQIIAANGTIVDFRGQIDATERAGIVGRNVSNRSYFRAAVNGSTRVGEPERFDDGGFAVTVSSPIRSENDSRIVGVFAAGATLRQSGILDPVASLTTDPETDARVTATLEGGEVGTLAGGEENVTNALRTDVTVEPMGWHLSIFRDRAALTGRLQSLQLIQGGSLFLVLVSMVGLGVWQYRTNLRQTERLLGGFRALEAGEFGHRLRMTAAEEWRQIGAGFNDLARGLREREEAIQEREQRLSVLNRVLRHNLQNDLTVVQGYAEMLDEFDEAELERASETIQNKVDGLISHGQKARQIEKALESAEEGRIDVDVVPELESMCETYGREYPDVEVDADLPETAPVSAISTVESGIESIVENAFEHNTSADPTVSIAVADRGDAVEIRVTDHGPGIPSHEYEVLEQDTETSLEHGSGIGLWLAYWVVEKSGGSLAFEDADPGTNVRITLPAGEEPQTGTGEGLLNV